MSESHLYIFFIVSRNLTCSNFFSIISRTETIRRSWHSLHRWLSSALRATSFVIPGWGMACEEACFSLPVYIRAVCVHSRKVRHPNPNSQHSLSADPWAVGVLYCFSLSGSTYHCKDAYEKSVNCPRFMRLWIPKVFGYGFGHLTLHLWMQPWTLQLLLNTCHHSMHV